MMIITVNENTLTLAEGNDVIFPHQTWQDYEQFINLRQEQKLPKLYFNIKTQEIRLTSPLASHGNRIDTLRDLVKSMLRKQEKDWECFDPITLKIPNVAGLEPDTSFYIDNRKAILGKNKIDLTIDPPPDLAIEVDFTSITDVVAYEILKIPELWIYRQECLNIYLLEGENYRESEISCLFPNINIKDILPRYVEFVWKEGSSIALRQFELEIFS